MTEQEKALTATSPPGVPSTMRFFALWMAAYLVLVVLVAWVLGQDGGVLLGMVALPVALCLPVFVDSKRYPPDGPPEVAQGSIKVRFLLALVSMSLGNLGMLL